MSRAVLPEDDLPTTPPLEDEERYRRAVEEARAQAESLRHAVTRANDLVRQLEEMVEALRAILVYPKAYDWPPLEPPAEGPTIEDVPTVLEDEPRAPA